MNIWFGNEFQISEQESLAMQRMRASMVSAGGWIIGERFDDRYDTAVGGLHPIVTQYLDDGGKVQGGFELSKFVKGEYPSERNPSHIVDYGDGGRHICVSAAEQLPELTLVLIRLREREQAYELFLAQRGK